jgi:uncharacterized protein YcbK (DUF882 family)
MRDAGDRNIKRRDFLKYMLSAAVVPLMPGDFLSCQIDSLLSERSLSFYNIHTGERLEAVYWSLGRYHLDALSRINHIMRDHRAGEVERIDVGLLEILHLLRKEHGTDEPFHIISGYRAPRTNRLMSRQSRGVAPTSLHTKGRAADIRLPGVRLSRLRESAMGLKLGGVGFYPSSGFVHLDTGKVKFWKGS